MLFLYVILAVVLIAAEWIVFEKAGQPGWGSLVPIYNVYLLLKIAGYPGWYLLLFFIAIMIMVKVAENFGKGIGFALGLIFLSFIFLPILAWGDATYQG